MKKRITLVELTKKNLEEKQDQLGRKKKVPKAFSHLEKRPQTPVTESIINFINNVELTRNNVEVENPNIILEKKDSELGFVFTEDSNGVPKSYVDAVEDGVLFNNPYSLNHMMKKLEVEKYQYDSFFPNSNNEVFGEADDYEKIRKKQNRLYALEIMNEGVGYIQKERFKKACEFLTRSIDFYGGNAEAYHHRGVAYLRQDMVKKAHADFEEALKLNPKLAECRKHFEETQKKIQQFERNASKIADPFEKDFLINTKSLPKRFLQARTPPKKNTVPLRRDRYPRRDDYSNNNNNNINNSNSRKRGRPEPMDQRNLREQQPPLKRRKIGDDLSRKSIILSKRKKSMSPPRRMRDNWGPGKKVPMSEMANVPTPTMTQQPPKFPVVQSYVSGIKGGGIVDPLHGVTNLPPPPKPNPPPPRYQPSKIQRPPYKIVQSAPLLNLHNASPIPQIIPPQRKDDVLRPLNPEVKYRPSNTVAPPPRPGVSNFNRPPPPPRPSVYGNQGGTPKNRDPLMTRRESDARRRKEEDLKRRRDDGRRREDNKEPRRRMDDRRRREDDELRRRRDEDDRRRRRDEPADHRRRREDEDLRRSREEDTRRGRRGGHREDEKMRVRSSVPKQKDSSERRKSEILKDYESRGGSRREERKKTPTRIIVKTTTQVAEKKPVGQKRRKVIKKVIKKIVRRKRKKKIKKKKKEESTKKEVKKTKENYFTPEREREASKYSPRRLGYERRDERRDDRRNHEERRRVYYSPERGRSKYDSPKRGRGRSPRGYRRSPARERQYSPHRKYSPRKYSGDRDRDGYRDRKRYSRDHERR